MKTYPLKRCPFCHATATANVDGYIIKVKHEEDCFFTFLDHPTSATDEEVIEAWNKRKDAFS